MKRLFGIAVMFVLAAGGAQGGGMGGLGGGNGLTAVYDAAYRKVRVHGSLDQANKRIEIIRRGTAADAEATTLYMDDSHFNRLQSVVDSGKVISIQDENDKTRSCRAYSGDQPQQVDLIENREAMRSEVYK